LINLLAKFEVSSLNRSQDYARGSKNYKIKSRDPLMELWPYFAFFDIASVQSICLWNLTQISSSVTDIWLIYHLADLAAKCHVRPFCSIGYCRDPQEAHPWPDTRVLAYRSFRSVKKCDLGARWRKQKRKKKKKNSDMSISSSINQCIIIQ